MRKTALKLIAFLFVAISMAVTSCGKSPEEQLKEVIGQTNSEIGGKVVSAGCVCDSVTYENGNMIYYFNFPGIDLGSQMTDDQFLELIKPNVDALLQGNLGSGANNSEISRLTDLLLECNAGVEFKMNFAGRSLGLDYSPEEIKTLVK